MNLKHPRIVEAEAEYANLTAPARQLIEQAKALRNQARELDRQAMDIKQQHHHLLVEAVAEVFVPGTIVYKIGILGVPLHPAYRVRSLDGALVWVQDTTNLRRRTKEGYRSLTLKEPDNAQL